MRVRFLGEDIPPDIREKLPDIPKAVMRERGCLYCRNYAGLYRKKHYCMMQKCPWDDDRGIYHPALLKLRPKYEAALAKAQANIAEEEKKAADAQQKIELLDSMFQKQLREEARKKDICYECPYSKNGPCVGICYQQLLSRGDET